MLKIHSILPATYQDYKETSNRNWYINILKFIIPAACFFGLNSCEKVIPLHLNSSTSGIVIQGNIYDQPGPYLVQLSGTVDFDQPGNYPPVTGARVEITDNVNQSEVLTETVSGTYATSKLRGIPGRSYTLTIKTGDQTYKSVASMPYPVSMDSIYFASNPFSGEKTTTVRFSDPPFSKNFYRLVYFVNNIRQKEFYVLDDELFQGSTIRYALQSRGSNVKLSPGDNVVVWLESIDWGAYEYFRTSGRDGGQSATPSNPVSNISNGALGYFSAGSVQKISAKVEK
jgi:hypothetical protein